MNIFITAIDSELGYHLTESLRQDHLLLQGYSSISGTKIHDHKKTFLLHDSIHATFDFAKQRDRTVKNAIESDVIIFDLRNDPVPQIEFILKVLKHHPTKKPLKLIAISNFATWSNSKQIEFAQNPQDKQTLLEHTVHKSHWKHSKLNKAHYPLRVPHPMFVYNYLLEEQILQLKCTNKMIQPVILCPGVLYGKSGFDMRGHLENAIKGQDDWLIEVRNSKGFGDDHVLPILHVDKLMEEVESIVYGKNNSTQSKLEEYKVLCQDNPSCIVKIVQTLNDLCGNNKQPHIHKSQTSKSADKTSVDLLKLPSSSENQSTGHTSHDLISPRAPSSNHVNRNSSSNNTPIPQSLTHVFVPELTFAKDKFKFSLLQNINFASNDDSNQTKTVKKEKPNKEPVQSNSVRRQSSVRNPQDQLLNKLKQRQSVQDNAWLKTAIQQYTEYFDCDFKHFLISQELYKEQEASSQKLPQSFVSRYFMIDRNILTQELNLLIENGTIPQDRLATPEEDKKKPPNKNAQNRQSATKEPYEMVFNQIILHTLKKYALSHFLVCLKADLIAKTLALLSEPGFEDIQNMRFISLAAKEPNPSTPVYPATQNVTKTLQLLCDEFYQIYDIANPLKKPVPEVGKSNYDEEEMKKSAIKSRRNLHGHKQAEDEAQELKINLLHQYLLDNLIVYVAEAKHNLQAKGKMRVGQKLQGKENLKLFIEQLKAIRARQIKLVCQEEELTEGS